MFKIPVINPEATGANINRLRKAAGLSVRDLQEVFGFATPQAIYKWQHGTALPSLDNIVLLAAVFHVSVDEILVLENTENTEGRSFCAPLLPTNPHKTRVLA